MTAHNNSLIRNHVAFRQGPREVLVRALQALFNGNRGAPSGEYAVRERDVRAPHLRIVGGQRLADDAAAASRDLDDLLGHRAHSHLVGIANVDRAHVVAPE